MNTVCATLSQHLYEWILIVDVTKEATGSLGTFPTNYCLVYQLDSDQWGVFMLVWYTAVSYTAWCPLGAMLSSTRKLADFLRMSIKEIKNMWSYAPLPPSTFKCTLFTSLPYPQVHKLSPPFPVQHLEIHKIRLFCSRGWKIRPCI